MAIVTDEGVEVKLGTAKFLKFISGLNKNIQQFNALDIIKLGGV